MAGFVAKNCDNSLYNQSANHNDFAFAEATFKKKKNKSSSGKTCDTPINTSLFRSLDLYTHYQLLFFHFLERKGFFKNNF